MILKSFSIEVIYKEYFILFFHKKGIKLVLNIFLKNKYKNEIRIESTY
jgi:hypothetical protein